MLHIQDISKKYVTGDLTQTALDHVTLSLRDNEFVAILGPSGSGKTTLLNVIGGLDRYDSGDLIIDGVSTRLYKDRDWDSYRNHKIGFVFQSYNLIAHQTLLSNVELSLTISGISPKERRKRAMDALRDVGLAEQAHKRPAQLSGGQMQRVAIARALVNDPQILLADEPTGALDTETSISVMELLKKVAKDRLVVMVTHNPDLARDYANRIVNLKDGRIINDTNPLVIEDQQTAVHKNLGKSSMSFLTSLGLSANNLRTKKGRTILTAFAGSIGIIGIALILSLSNGVSQSIKDIQKKTMSSYPISISETTYNLSAMMDEDWASKSDESQHEKDAVYGNNETLSDYAPFTLPENYVIKNNLTPFKAYLEKEDSPIRSYLGDNGIVYSYDTSFSVYAFDPEGTFVSPDSINTRSYSSTGLLSLSLGLKGNAHQPSSFTELLPGRDHALVSAVILENYDLLYGSWPANTNELVLVLDDNNEFDTELLYNLGFFKQSEYQDMVMRLENGEKVDLPEIRLDYEAITEQTLYLLPSAETYTKNDDLYRKYTSKELESIVKEQAIPLHFSGIIRPKENAQNASLTTPIGYTQALTDLIIDRTDKAQVVLDQTAEKTRSLLTGLRFEPETDEERIENARIYLKSLSLADRASLFESLLDKKGMGDLSGGFDPEALSGLEGMGNLSGMMSGLIGGLSGGSSSESEASFMDAFFDNLDDETLLYIFNTRMVTNSYQIELSTLGVVNRDNPKAINIYVDTFQAKDNVAKCIEEYNKTVSPEDKITYQDMVGLLMKSVTSIVNAISYVLIAFVAVSLIVSSIMIGIITYISVLERTREIGILRALGASKKNISQVFNAETFLIGLLAGIIGIGLTLLLLFPINAIIHAVAKTKDVSAALPILPGLVLIALSTFLTMIGGFIPSRKAAKKDPVAALRSE